LTCLIFDSDGTLVDSELLNCRAMATELSNSGIVVSAETLAIDFRGWQLDALLGHLQKQQSVRLDEGFVARFRDRAFDIFKSELQPVEHVITALDQLPQRKCVASNGPQEKLELALRLTGLTDYFGGNVFSAYDVGSSKPEPGLFLHAAEKMGCPAHDCIVIEDSSVGIEAALAARMHAIFYTAGVLPPHADQSVISIDSMQQLPAAIAGAKASRL